MFFKKRIHSVPELNTTSTADISFMLLIFFLVTTSMDVDKGLQRQLPPIDNQENKEEIEVDKNKLMTLTITADNKLSIDGNPIDMDKLHLKIEAFVNTKGKQHIISIDCDPDASYNTYFSMQNEIVVAYNNVRNQMALKKYSRPFQACSQQQKDAIREMCPQRIAETYKTKEEGGGQ